jgi:hypothetical protein
MKSPPPTNTQSSTNITKTTINPNDFQAAASSDGT